MNFNHQRKIRTIAKSISVIISILIVFSVASFSGKEFYSLPKPLKKATNIFGAKPIKAEAKTKSKIYENGDTIRRTKGIHYKLFFKSSHGKIKKSYYAYAILTGKDKTVTVPETIKAKVKLKISKKKTKIKTVKFPIQKVKDGDKSLNKRYSAGNPIGQYMYSKNVFKYINLSKPKKLRYILLSQSQPFVWKNGSIYCFDFQQEVEHLSGKWHSKVGPFVVKYYWIREAALSESITPTIAQNLKLEEVKSLFNFLEKYDELKAKAGNDPIKYVKLVFDFVNSVKYKNDKSSGYYSWNKLYSIFVNGYGVCEHKANVFYLLCSLENIECRIVSHKTPDHAWNKVLLKGRWYNLDATNNFFLVKDSAIYFTYLMPKYYRALFPKAPKNFSDIYGANYFSQNKSAA